MQLNYVKLVLINICLVLGDFTKKIMLIVKWHHAYSSTVAPPLQVHCYSKFATIFISKISQKIGQKFMHPSKGI